MKIFQTRLNNGSINLSLLILRLTAGGFMLTHGLPKLLHLLSGDFQFGDPLGIGSGVSLVLAIFAEFFCSVLVMLGFGTRLAVIPLIATMSVAAFISHGADPFGRKELALFYLASYIVLLLSGSGKFSVDRLVGRK